MKRLSIYACLIALTGITSGCALFDSGNSKFACPNNTEGVRCYSAKQVYGLTNNSSHITATSQEEMNKNIEAVNAGKAPNEEAHAQEDEYEGQAVMLPEADRPLPVRMNAKVIRVKVFPYEDERGVFHAGDYLYAEVQGRKWTLTPEQTSKTTAAANKVLTPLQASTGGTSPRN
ncbi:MAG: type IV conjugative transfer system lipoprotein TraV [Methylophilus sp.]|uniref:type IV conjugative transfer system lipoprotein TraV n=1 Tax=Methylophilus sp. TaxID=29541 RepID=UPI003FA14BEB